MIVLRHGSSLIPGLRPEERRVARLTTLERREDNRLSGEVPMERKLAAIFSTDVQGYSRLMGDNEEATIRTLTSSAWAASTQVW